MMVHYPEELGSNVSQSDNFSHEGAWNGKANTEEGGGERVHGGALTPYCSRTSEQ